MSLPWVLVRGASANPSALKFAALMNKQNIAENEVFKPERKDPQILSNVSDDLVTVQDPFDFRKSRFIANMHYAAPFEPDGIFTQYWCKFNHLGNRIKDESFTGHHTISAGSPRLCAGPDDGITGGTIVSKINTGNTIDYFYSNDSPGIRVSGISVGFSVYVEFMAESLSQHNLIDPTIGMKVDDTTGANGWMLRIGTAGQLKFFVRKNSQTYDFISPNNKITLGRYIGAFLTYNPVGNVLTMRINDEPQVDSGTEAVVFPANHSLNLFWGVGPNQISGRFPGRLKDSRWYNNLVFTTAHQNNLWGNKRSITAIQYGKLAVASTSRFNDTVYTDGYDVDGFDSTGYETGGAGSGSGYDSTGYDSTGYYTI